MTDLEQSIEKEKEEIIGQTVIVQRWKRKRRRKDLIVRLRLIKNSQLKKKNEGILLDE